MESKVWTGKEMVTMLGEEPAQITSFALKLYQVLDASHLPNFNYFAITLKGKIC